MLTLRSFIQMIAPPHELRAGERFVLTGDHYSGQTALGATVG